MMIPKEAYQICVQGGLIVGSMARKLATGKGKPKDIDILVPYEAWQRASVFIPMNAKPNAFRGFRFYSESKGNKWEVDVWPSSVEHYLSTCKSRHGSTIYVVDFISGLIMTSYRARL